MAQKRMFDKSIIDTDKFMDLSMSSKALYFLLGMDADDEGFVSYKKVMRVHGGNDDDIRVLVAKNFIIPFESGVVVITDWNENNWLDSRRIKPTQYQKEKNFLSLTSNKKYVLSNSLASIEESSIEESRTIGDFDLEKELSILESYPGSPEDTVATFIRQKQLTPKNRKQLDAIIDRHYEYAKKLTAWTPDEILKTMEFLENKKTHQINLKGELNVPDWTIETTYKYLTK